MKFHPYLFLSPLGVVTMAALGRTFTSESLDGWYLTLNLPSWTPPGHVIGAAWTIIYLLMMIAGFRYFAAERDPKRANAAAGAFVLNMVLNVGWSWLFFRKHFLLAAFWEAVALGLSVVLLIVLFRRASPSGAAMLVPYAAWVVFASHLTLSVYLLNR